MCVYVVCQCSMCVCQRRVWVVLSTQNIYIHIYYAHNTYIDRDRETMKHIEYRICVSTRINVNGIVLMHR